MYIAAIFQHLEHETDFASRNDVPVSKGRRFMSCPGKTMLHYLLILNSFHMFLPGWHKLGSEGEDFQKFRWNDGTTGHPNAGPSLVTWQSVLCSDHVGGSTERDCW